uniref:Methyltransferase domain-containing protein n=1 Tax=viral metagenome TaxID=1070528 RepID=A0A6C0LDB5_9ZZZZ
MDNSNIILYETMPEWESYEAFVQSIENNIIPNIDKDILLYLLVNNFIDSTGLWLEFGTGYGTSTNHISHYCKDIVYSFDSFKPNSFNSPKNISLPHNLNKNIEIITGWFIDTIPIFKNNQLFENYISFLHVDCDIYESTCQVLNELHAYIKPGCIIVFGKLLNFLDYQLHQLKAFYEFIRKYKIKFEWIGMNGSFSKNVTNNNCHAVGIKIIHNPFFYLSSNTLSLNPEQNKEMDEKFDWKKYISYYSDLSHFTNKNEAWDHWIKNGEKECRVYFNKDDQEQEVLNLIQKQDILDLIQEQEIKYTFDWITYKNTYEDLYLIDTLDEAWNHWIHHGKIEERKFFSIEKNDATQIRGIENEQSIETLKLRFDWVKYVDTYDDLGSINTLEQAWDHWIHNGRNENRKYFSMDIKRTIHRVLSETKLNSEFDWLFYINNYDDLSHLTNEKDAWNHWIEYGKNENRDAVFNWCEYIGNLNLSSLGINSKGAAFEHWLKNGKKRYKVPHDFNWVNYIRKNIELTALVNTESEAIYHWLNIGSNQNLSY